MEGKGFSVKNVGTGKYLKDATSPAKYDEPTYFTFCTLKEKTTTGIETLNVERLMLNNNQWYSLDGRQLSGKPSQPGIYIQGGRKYVIK